MFTVVVATLAVNIAANVVSPANDFANAFPKYVSFKTGGLITGLLGIVVQGSLRSGWPVRLFGELRLVTFGFAAAAIGYATLGLSHAIPTLLLAATFSSLGNGLIRPALTSLITQQVGRGEQGAVLGLNQSLMSVAQIVGPAIAGTLIDRGWLSTWAFWTALITVVAVVLNRNAREARHAATDHLERA